VEGVATGILYSRSIRDKKNVGVMPATAIEDPIFEELRLWIVPTEDDLIPFRQVNSAQSQALEWLRSDPITLSDGRSTQTVLQRYVLAVLYFATTGHNWFWPYLSSDDVCTWHTWWDGGRIKTGVFCDTNNGGETVDTIDLSGNNLRGPLPWELTLLTNLRHIDLERNRISGTIPSRIHELSLPETFFAKGNDLTGTLPKAFGPSIYHIDLALNSMNGSIPEDWDTRMPKLGYLSLGLNLLTGTIPSNLGNINHQWEVFEVFGNSITGSVDPFLCGNFSWKSLALDCEEVQCSCCTMCCTDEKNDCVSTTDSP